jgi:hypothetical protein
MNPMTPYIMTFRGVGKTTSLHDFMDTLTCNHPNKYESIWNVGCVGVITM